jgi:malate synthase
VRQDKLREVRAGHDGTWVAHPGLVAVAKDIFDEYMQTPNQIDRRTGSDVSAANLLEVPAGSITEEGLRWNVDVGMQYFQAWLGGNGCVPIYNLMEDAATAEICRAQVWQWVRHGAKMADGRTVTPELVRQIIGEVKAKLAGKTGGPDLSRAATAYEQMMTSEEFPEFLTLVAYSYLD